jgi:uroporphyrinogen III methyltransferase / synthase
VADPGASPLAGKTVFVSRASQRAEDLCRELERRGARAIGYPLIRFGPPDDFRPLDQALQNLDRFDWMIFTSQVAVEFVAQRASSIGAPITKSGSTPRVAVVGPATATAATKAGLPVDYVTRKSQGAAFAEELAQELKGKRIFLPHSNLAIKSVVEGLKQNGSDVTGIIAYRTLPPSQEEQKQVSAIQWGIVDAALFFSPSAVQNFVDAVGIRRVKEHHQHIVFVAVGPTTAQSLRDLLGFEDIIQALSPSVAGVLGALEHFLKQRSGTTS